jgi:hypothetical protein
MTDDLVKRLREGCGCEFVNDECEAKDECRDAFEAADRIDELEDWLRLIAEHPVDKTKQWEVGCKEMKGVARAALGEKADG